MMAGPLEQLAAIGGPDDARPAAAVLMALDQALEPLEIERRRLAKESRQAEAWAEVARHRDALAAGEAGALPALLLAVDDVRRATGEAPPLPVLEGDEIGHVPPPAVYPMRGFPLRAGTVSVVAGAPFAGKTTILYDLLLAVAMGGRAWERFACELGTSLLWDVEMGEREAHDCLRRLVAASRLPVDWAAVGRRLKRVFAVGSKGLGERALFTTEDRGRAILRPGLEEQLVRALEGVTVAAFDSLSSLCPGLDENATEAAGPIYLLGRVARRTGTAIVVLHHMRKTTPGGPKDDSGAGIRGSGAILGAADKAWMLAPQKKQPPRLSQAKGRGFGDPRWEDFHLEIESVDVRQPDLDLGWSGYFNPSNASDFGGLAVRYKTCEQVKPPKEEDGDFEADVASVLEYVLKETAHGRPLGSKGQPSKPCRLRKSATLDAFNALLARGQVKSVGKRGGAPYLATPPRLPT